MMSERSGPKNGAAEFGNPPGDRLTAWFRRCLAPDVYVGIELEVNQKLVFGARRRCSALPEILVESLRGALASHPDETAPTRTAPSATAIPAATA